MGGGRGDAAGLKATFKGPRWTADAEGNMSDPLLLADCSQVWGSPLRLLSVSLLCEHKTSFHF